MADVVFIYGEPNAGKTTLAKRLHDDYGLEVLHLDETYCEFIKRQIPELYFPYLRDYISPHYPVFLQNGRQYGLAKYGRDFHGEWRSWLGSHVADLAHEHGKLVVEGWLLYDFKEWFRNTPHAASIVIHEIKVAAHRCYLSGPITSEQIATLGG